MQTRRHGCERTGHCLFASFAYAELTEDFPEERIRRHLANNRTKRVMCSPQILRNKFAGSRLRKSE